MYKQPTNALYFMMYFYVQYLHQHISASNPAIFSFMFVMYQTHQPEDGRITGRNMLVKILYIKIHHKIKCGCLYIL
jgi:hypothetical protein